MNFDHKQWTIHIVTGSDFYAIIYRPGASIAEIIAHEDVPRSTFGEGPMVCLQRAKEWIDRHASSHQSP